MNGTMRPSKVDLDASRFLVRYLQTHDEELRFRIATAGWPWWIGSNEDCATPQEFAQRITVTMIELSTGKQPELWYDDDGLVHGHSISVSLTLSGTFDVRPKINF
jgi:hypothetical protein